MSKKCACLITILVFSLVSIIAQTSKKPIVKSKNTKIQNSKQNNVKKNDNWKLMTFSDLNKVLTNSEVLKVQYFRTDRVQRKGTMVEFWMKTKFFHPKSLGIQNYESLSQMQGDCNNKKMRVLYSIEYYENGNIKSEDSTKSEFSPVIPDTVGEEMINLACSTKLNK
jgi:hypothetical protein